MSLATESIVKSVRRINLEKKLKTTHISRRMGNAVRLFREEIARHAASNPDNVFIGSELNRYLVIGASHGFRGVNVSIEKKGERISVDLAERRKKEEKKEEAPKTVVEKLTEKTAEEKVREKKSSAEVQKKEPKQNEKADTGRKKEKKEGEQTPQAKV